MEALRRTLNQIDGRGYKAYKDIEGIHEGPGFTLYVDHVQGDPFAELSKMRLRVPSEVAQLPVELYSSPVRRRAFQDFLARQVTAVMERTGKASRGSGKSGELFVDAGAQEVIERTALVVAANFVEVRLQAGLPAAGRRVLARDAIAMLCEQLPVIARQALRWGNLPQDSAFRFVECVENQEYIRTYLDAEGLVAFVADGSSLPRASGASDLPLESLHAIRFVAPDSLAVEFDLPNAAGGGRRRVRGLGIPKGVTLIVGGGYHGKSTLLKALERSIHPHIPGDGRELVVTSSDAVKIRAEDGRRVERVNIDAFITKLPQERSTECFSSDDASGSTSQAASIVEAVEAGATCLLMDEDTCATNFMVRDARMQALVAKEHEPITPFLDRVRELYDTRGISTVLVMGGCGDYFDVADRVIRMHEFLPREVTSEAREVAARLESHRKREVDSVLPRPTPRIPLAESFDASRGRRDVKITAREVDLIDFGTARIDLRGVDQLVDLSQTRAIGHAIHFARKNFMDGEASLREVVDALDAFLDEQGLDVLDPHYRKGRHPGNFARPRKHELAAAINRLRTLRMKP